MRRSLTISAVGCMLALVGSAGPSGSPGASAATPSDAYCTGSYGGASPRSGTSLRFGIDPGLAGSVGGAQLPAVPDNPKKDLAAIEALDGRRQGQASGGGAHPLLVVRLNRLFWSEGKQGIERFRRKVAMYTGAGLEVELQVRYHPPQGKAGDIPAWVAYVGRVVDAFGANSRVVAMTITNEVNVQFSPNTSDGYYARAQDALIRGIEAAHQEAARRGFHQLRFGFTYAYRFPDDASFFSYLGEHGGKSFHRALDFVGLDFYPGTVYPPAMPPGGSYRTELAKAAGLLRECLEPKARIGSRVPIWITENGVPTGRLSGAQQAAALRQLVRAANDYSGTFGITDYRWFNLRDSSESPAKLVGPTFSSDGLLRADYARKPSFGAYKRLIARLSR